MFDYDELRKSATRPEPELLNYQNK